MSSSRGGRSPGRLLLVLLPILLNPPPARAQEGHEHHAGPGHGDHGRVWERGAWRIAGHGFANLGVASEGGPRGDTDVVVGSMIGAAASRSAGKGELTLSAMLSADPVMGPEGYPLLLQTGETADGVNNLFDRQHPHDLFMELGVRFRHPLGDDGELSLYAALPGEPALGPPAFVHRASAGSLPLAPTTHHWMDSTHVAFGVVTAGLTLGPATLEASRFTGAEPDERRWNFEEPSFDSYSGRLTLRLGGGWSLQGSAGHLVEPEFAHPGVDIDRYTASLTHALELASGARLDSTLAWGSNRRSADIAPPAFERYPPSRRSDAWLLESRLRWRDQDLALRVGWAEKDEVFPLDHPFHGRLFPTTRVTLSYLVHGPGPLPRRIGVGAAGAILVLPDELVTFYGERPNSLTAFLRLEL
jgi:hypothetical protein